MFIDNIHFIVKVNTLSYLSKHVNFFLHSPFASGRQTMYEMMSEASPGFESRLPPHLADYPQEGPWKHYVFSL